MRHILCADKAPLEIYTLLEDLFNDPTEQDLFVAMIVESTSLEGFAFVDEPLEGHEGCTMINVMLHCLALSDATRISYLLEDQPQLDFETGELASWEGMVLAIQFASRFVLNVLVKKIPPEFIAYGIESLPEGDMRLYLKRSLQCVN